MDNVSIQSILAICSSCGMDVELLKKKLLNGEAFKYRGIGKLTHKKMCDYFGVSPAIKKLTELQKKINHADRLEKYHQEKAKHFRGVKKVLASEEVKP